ncbi:MAG: phosphopantetheine-binding protein [Polyangiaceae bacterium]
MPSIDDSLVRVAVALHLDVALDSVHSEDHLVRDLGLDPLDLVLVVLRLDELVGAQCALANLQSIETVRDLEDMVRDWQRASGQSMIVPSRRKELEASRKQSGTLPIPPALVDVRKAG